MMGHPICCFNYHTTIFQTCLGGIVFVCAACVWCLLFGLRMGCAVLWDGNPAWCPEWTPSNFRRGANGRAAQRPGPAGRAELEDRSTPVDADEVLTRLRVSCSTPL